MQKTLWTKARKIVGTLALGVAIALTCSLASTAFAAETINRDFTLHNKSGKAILFIYLSPTHDKDNWGEDVLEEEDTLSDGDSSDITFTPENQTEWWDMKVMFEDEKEGRFFNLHLSEITDITVTHKNGVPHASAKKVE